LASLPQWKRYGLVLGSLVIALLPWLVLPFDTLSVGFFLLEFALLLAYAIPPFRLKGRRTWALFADAAYAYAIPAVLAAHTFFLAGARQDNPVFLGSLFVWQLALGIRHFLNHLALDRTNDIRSGTPTLAVHKGNRYINGLIRHVVLPVELVGFLAYLLVMSGYLHLLILTVSGVLLLSSSFHTVLTIGRGYPLLTYRFSKTQVDSLYQDILPLVLITYLVLADWRFCLLFLVHVILFFGMEASAFTLRVMAWPGMMLLHGSRHQVNESVSNSIVGASESVYPPAKSDTESVTRAKRPERVNIALVNINKAKYTETFVHRLLSRLPYNVYYLYGDELPQFDDDDRHFLSNRLSLQSLAQFLEVVLRLEKNHLLKNSIASYLQAKHIRLVLAEFGPVGNAMVPITKDLGIPLVVCFHGYDAFNKETLRRCGPQYAALFREATRIIGVSETMLDRLHELGAPRDKLVHLPAFVDLELFSYTDQSIAAPRFLAVGRFAETKSPHLTLLAFQQVARVIPQATLTMIGKGGGGEPRLRSDTSTLRPIQSTGFLHRKSW